MKCPNVGLEQFSLDYYFNNYLTYMCVNPGMICFCVKSNLDRNSVSFFNVQM